MRSRERLRRAVFGRTAVPLSTLFTIILRIFVDRTLETLCVDSPTRSSLFDPDQNLAEAGIFPFRVADDASRNAPRVSGCDASSPSSIFNFLQCVLMVHFNPKYIDIPEMKDVKAPNRIRDVVVGIVAQNLHMIR